MDFAGLLGGHMAEVAFYIRRAFEDLKWANFVAPTLKTAVFGFIIGTVSSYFGYTTNMGAAGVGRAATNSVVVSSLMVIVADVFLVKCIFFAFLGGALL
jgi:phospholipid/cholesterol/gamma-HCH transport system permease protein